MEKFDLRLFRLEKIEGKVENFAIVTKAQLELELHFLLGSATGELNGMYLVSSFCLESCRASEHGSITQNSYDIYLGFSKFRPPKLIGVLK